MSTGSSPLSFAAALAGWREDHRFRAYFVSVLAGMPFDAFFWEMPPLSVGTLDRPFEFVVVDSPPLARMPVDRAAFAAQLEAAEGEVAVFPNLGGDAILVAPCASGNEAPYGHLASFSRGAGARPNDQLWRLVGQTVGGRLGDEPLWVSTSGLGVAWLHVRLDSRPKYYTYAPYRRAT